MSHPNVPGRGRDNGSPSGHKYQDIQIGGGAKAHLGDTYHLGEYAPKDCKEEAKRTQDLIPRSIVYLTLLKRPSIRTRDNTSLPALPTPASIFFTRYIHGLTDKMSGVSSG
jgi:hypothetical protein